jgi:hypothetical protein
VAEAADLGADDVVVATGASGRRDDACGVAVDRGRDDRLTTGSDGTLSATMSIAPIMHIMSTILEGGPPPGVRDP